MIFLDKRKISFIFALVFKCLKKKLLYYFDDEEAKSYSELYNKPTRHAGAAVYFTCYTAD